MARDLVVIRSLDRHTPLGIHEAGERIRLLRLIPEHCPQHLDHVLVRVVIVVEQHEMVRRLEGGIGLL